MGQNPDASTGLSLRIGLFGGTFDPPHRGHTAVVADVADVLELDQVLWIPANQPPYNSLTVPAPVALRIEMTRAAVEADLRFEVSEVEAERGGVSYTVETVRALRESYPGTILFLIIGTDQFSEFNAWRSPEELLHLATDILVGRRPDLQQAGLDPAVPSHLSHAVDELHPCQLILPSCQQQAGIHGPQRIPPFLVNLHQFLEESGIGTGGLQFW